MRTTTVGMAGRRPLRWHHGDGRGPSAGFRSGELAAGLATAAAAVQLLFIPPVLVAAATLVVIGRVSRWRPHWLAAATGGALIWLFAVGPAAALAAFAAGTQRLAALWVAVATDPRLFAHHGVFGTAREWPPTGLPLALFAACGEAWLVLWIGWWRPGAATRSRWWWRPGLMTMVRHRTSAAALAAGRTATSRGCVVGVATDTGKLAGFSWAEAMHGVLLAGEDLDTVGLAMTGAALKRRKTVVLLECAGLAASASTAARGCEQVGSSALTERVGQLARSLGVQVKAGVVAPLAGVIGLAIRRRDTVLIEERAANSASRAAGELAAALTELRELGLRADCLAWITGVESMDAAILDELLALGPRTGTVIVLSAKSSDHAVRLASLVGVIAAGRPVGTDLRLALAARLSAGDVSHAIRSTRQAGLGGQRPGAATMLVFPAGSDGSPSMTTCRVTPIVPGH